MASGRSIVGGELGGADFLLDSSLFCETEQKDEQADS